MVVAVDYDGTITEYRNGPIRSDFLKYAPLICQRHTLVLNTARKGLYRWRAIKAIRATGIKMVTNIRRKPKADVYVDDKNIFCQEISWKAIWEFLRNA